MCMSINEAVFSQTRIVTWRTASGFTGLLYQNEAQNTVSGPNAMIFCIPLRPTKENLELLEQLTFNTEAFPEIAANIVETEPPFPAKGRSMGGPLCFVARDDEPESRMFESGPYTVVIADLRAVNSALEKVSPAKRPFLPENYAQGIAETGRGEWTAVICCFDGNELKKAPPIMFYYAQDLLTNYRIFPALDAHHGGPPDLSAFVMTDHALATDIDHLPDEIKSKIGGKVEYANLEQMPPFVQANLPEYVVTTTSATELPNGDWILDTANKMFQTGMVNYEGGASLATDLLHRCLERFSG